MFTTYTFDKGPISGKYRELKERLAATYPFDRVSYTNAKAPFIQKILELAKTQKN